MRGAGVNLGSGGWDIKIQQGVHMGNLNIEECPEGRYNVVHMYQHTYMKTRITQLMSVPCVPSLLC